MKRYVCQERPGGMDNPQTGNLGILGVHLDADEVEAFELCRASCRAAAHERVEDGAAGWGHEAHEPAHEADGLDGAMEVAKRNPAFGVAC